jgi:hypothetical protein
MKIGYPLLALLGEAQIGQGIVQIRLCYIPEKRWVGISQVCGSFVAQ